MLRSHVFVMVALPICSSLVAQEAEDAAAMAPLRSTIGRWVGSLEYADFTTGERIRLPARMRGELSDTGAALWHLAFSDPGREVRSLEMVSLDLEAGSATTVSFDGRGIERSDYRIARRERLADGLQLVLVAEGQDNGRPAEIRATWVLRTSELRSRTEVRYSDTDEATWSFRNEVRLARESADEVEALLGRWRVDLRPTPDADPYYIDMVIEVDDEGRLQGTFYGSEIREVRTNRGWGSLRFAFVTEDGSGVYHTSAVLRDGRLEGVTHSLGRDFLSVWKAERRNG